MDEWNKMAEWFPTSIKVLTFPFYWNNVLSDAALMQSLQQLIFPSLYVERLTRLMFSCYFYNLSLFRGKWWHMDGVGGVSRGWQGSQVMVTLPAVHTGHFFFLMYLFCNLRIVLISWSQSLICDKQINPFLTLSNRTFVFKRKVRIWLWG